MTFKPTLPNGYVASTLATPITSLTEAHVFFTRMAIASLLFHPEDDPATVVDANGRALFDDSECALLRKRVSEVYAFDSDPCAFCLDITGEQLREAGGA